MSIYVKFDSISSNESQQVIDYYNTIKPTDFAILEKLDRCEGGFQITLNETEKELMNSLRYYNSDINYNIKQLRWNKKKLDSYKYIGFNREETMLLYKSFIHVFDESLVVFQ